MAGRYGRTEIIGSLVLLPAMLTGYFLSHRTIGLVDGGWTRTAVLSVSGLSGAAIILREIL